MADRHRVFWDWAVALYGRDGVADACLALQDRYGADVNLLLYAIRAGSLGIALDRDALRRLDAAAAPLRREVTARLRSARTWLKRRAAEPGFADLRRHILDLELEAERLHQATLLATGPILPTAAADPADGATLATANVDRYLRLIGAGESARGLARSVLDAAFPAAGTGGIVGSPPTD